MAGNDTVDLTSAIGTWVATAIAIAALVGVVGPYLALQASLSDRNRAMNAVQDFSGKYVTRGYRLTRGMRIFRRIRVPNLAPSYITNEMEKGPLVPPAAAQGFWTLRGRSYHPFNTGWAKLAELIGAYEVHDRASDDVVDLAVPRDGTLEIVNSRTALVVSKHWILLMGLLGRYGNRPDKGVLHKRGIRREEYGERIMMSDIKNIWEHDTVYKKSVARPRISEKHGTVEYISGDLDLFPDEYEPRTTLTVRRNAYGEWTIDDMPSPMLFGITGTIRPIWRQKGSWSYLSSMFFVPRSEGEMFPPKGKNEKRDVASAETLFWLAQGFLPCGVESDGRRVVISLEDPDTMEDDGSGARSLEGISIFDLQEADDVPLSIGNALRSLGLTEPKEPKVLRLLPYDGDVEKLRISDLDTGTPVNLPQRHSISVGKSAVAFQGQNDEVRWVFPRTALEKPLGVFLSLDWDPWGFLVRRDKLFITLLSGTISILRERFIRQKKFWEALDMSMMPTGAFQHDLKTTFSARVLEDRMALDEALSACLKGSDVLPLKLSLGALFVLDDRFKGEVLRLVGEMGRARRRKTVPELVARLKSIEDEYEVAKAEHGVADGETSKEVAEGFAGRTGSHNGLETNCEGMAEDSAVNVSISNFSPPDSDDSDRESEDSSEGMAGGTSSVNGSETGSNDSDRESDSLAEESVVEDGHVNGKWPRIPISLLDKETLDTFGVKYVSEEIIHFPATSPHPHPAGHTPRMSLTEDEYHVIKRRVPRWEMVILKSHTRTLQAIRVGMNATEHNLDYDYSTKEFTWRRDSMDGETAEVCSWSLEGELLRVSKTEKGRVEIDEKDILLVCLWVANRAAMWIGSLDSKPLLSFVEELDPHVYVL